MKVCKKCLVEKQLEAFSWVGLRRPNLRRVTCKQCSSAQAKAYHLANTEKVRERKRLFRVENGEAMRKRESENYWSNRYESLAKDRAYKARNRDRLLERGRKYNNKNRAKRRESYNLYAKNHPSKVNAKKAKRHAQKLNATPK